MIKIWQAYNITSISDVQLLHVSLWSVRRNTKTFDGILDSFKKIYGLSQEIQFPYAVTIEMVNGTDKLEEKWFDRDPSKTKVYVVGQLYYIAELVEDVD